MVQPLASVGPALHDSKLAAAARWFFRRLGWPGRFLVGFHARYSGGHGPTDWNRRAGSPPTRGSDSSAGIGGAMAWHSPHFLRAVSRQPVDRPASCCRCWRPASPEHSAAGARGQPARMAGGSGARVASRSRLADGSADRRGCWCQFAGSHRRARARWPPPPEAASSLLGMRKAGHSLAVLGLPLNVAGLPRDKRIGRAFVE